MISWIFLAFANITLFSFLKLNKDELKKKQITEISYLQLSFYLVLFAAYFLREFFYNKYNSLLVFFLYSFCIHFFLFFKTYRNYRQLKKSVFNAPRLFFISFLSIIFAFIIEQITPFFYTDTFYFPEFFLSQYRFFIIVIFLSFLPAFLEEYFYRELIYSKLKKIFNVFLTISISSILFYLTHLVFNPFVQSFFYLIPLGLILGFIRAKSNTVLPCIIFHFFYNLTVMTLEVYF
tara:strand:+ start:4399 stop:5100 length:702 start_codon:yes stop_codon:yes gene_type:complete